MEHMIRHNLNTCGYHVLGNPLSKRKVAETITELKELPVRRTPLNELDHSQWWDEVGITQDHPITKKILTPLERQLIKKEFGSIMQCVFWANIYRIGENIPLHRDQNGDLQLILPLVVPPPECGGKLILHFQEPQKLELVPGTKILFQAHKTLHETTPLIFSNRTPNPIRAVCVCRMYF